MSGWFPRVAQNGQHIISGNIDLFLDNQLYINDAVSGCWLNNEVFLYKTHSAGELRSRNIRTNEDLHLLDNCSWVEGNANRWVANTYEGNVPVIKDSKGSRYPTFGGAMRSCSIDFDGTIVCARNSDGLIHISENGTLKPLDHIGGMLWIDHGRVYCEDNAQIYEYKAGNWSNISIGPKEYWPIIKENWICYYTDSRLIARKLDTNLGFTIVTGDSYYPDFVKVGDILHFAWSDGKGNLFTATRSVSDPLEDVSEPVEVSYPVGTVVPSPVEFFNVEFHRTGSHPMEAYVRDGITTFVKFQSPDALEQYENREDGIHLIYDHTDGREDAWKIEPSFWIPKGAKVGDTYSYPDAMLSRGHPDGSSAGGHKFPYKIYIRSLTKNVKVGKGYREVLTVEFILTDWYKERFHYARNYGWFKWERIENGQYMDTAIFDQDAYFHTIPSTPINIPTYIPPIVKPPEEKPSMAQYNDAEYEDLGKFLDEKYQVDLGREKQDTFVDSIGRGRWTHDYIRERDKGLPHDAALQVINERINDIVGLPDGQSPRPFPQPETGLVGSLSIKWGVYADLNGPVLPLFCHFGEAFSKYIRDPGTVERQLRVIKDAGYQGIRFWDVLGYYDSVWKGKEVTPIGFRNKSGEQVNATPDYYGKLEAFLNLVKSLGLKTYHSRGDLNAWNVEQLREHLRTVASLYDRVGVDVCAVSEGNNENWQNGDFSPEELRSALQPFKDRNIIIGLSTPETEEPTDLATMSKGADIWIIHGYRQGEYYDRIRHIFSLAYENSQGRPKLGWQGEPTGPGDGVTVGQTNEPEVLVMLAVMSLMSRQGWNYMSSNGVFFNGPIEDMPGFYAVGKANTLLPPDIMSYETLCHGGASQRGKRVYAVPGTDQTRADHAIANDGRFAVLLYGPRWRECTIERPHDVTSEVVFGNYGKLIVGKVR